MGSLKLDRRSWRWFPAAIAGGTLGVWGAGCTSRLFHYGFDTEGDAGSGSSGDTGDTDSTGDPTDPTSNPTAPTTSPTDPTTDPTDPTVDPTGNPDAPPQLINVAFVDNLTLQLTFSEPMAPVDDVDPTVFRLSMGFGYTEGYNGYTRTFYQEVGYFNQQPCYEEKCYENCYYDKETGEKYCYEYCYCPYNITWIEAIGLRNDSADATKVLLTLNPGIGSNVCDVAEMVPPEYTVALLLHYTDDRPPLPLDTQGQGLYPIGEDWVNTGEGFLDVEGFFPQLNPMLPIPCPF